jgi:hypothetical protein
LSSNCRPWGLTLWFTKVPVSFSTAAVLPIYTSHQSLVGHLSQAQFTILSWPSPHRQCILHPVTQAWKMRTPRACIPAADATSASRPPSHISPLSLPESGGGEEHSPCSVTTWERVTYLFYHRT